MLLVNALYADKIGEPSINSFMSAQAYLALSLYQCMNSVSVAFDIKVVL